MRDQPKFYIRRFECWGGSFVYCVAECSTRKVASSMYKQRKTAEKLLERMEADWERWLDRDAPKSRGKYYVEIACDKAGVKPG